MAYSTTPDLRIATILRADIANHAGDISITLLLDVGGTDPVEVTEAIAAQYVGEHLEGRQVLVAHAADRVRVLRVDSDTYGPILLSPDRLLPAGSRLG